MGQMTTLVLLLAARKIYSVRLVRYWNQVNGAHKSTN